MNTPIYDQLHNEMFPQRVVRCATDVEFREAYGFEKTRWADLSRRLAER